MGIEQQVKDEKSISFRQHAYQTARSMKWLWVMGACVVAFVVSWNELAKKGVEEGLEYAIQRNYLPETGKKMVVSIQCNGGVMRETMKFKGQEYHVFYQGLNKPYKIKPCLECTCEEYVKQQGVFK